MTTIAYKKNESISSDSQATVNNYTSIMKNTKKLYKLKNGIIAGCSGDLSDIREFVNILENIDTFDDIFNKENNYNLNLDINCIVIKDKIAYNFVCAGNNEDSLAYYEIFDDYYAVGSGKEFALSALYFNKTTKEAVEASINFDIYSGGKVNTISLK